MQTQIKAQPTINLTMVVNRADGTTETITVPASLANLTDEQIHELKAQAPTKEQAHG